MRPHPRPADPTDCDGACQWTTWLAARTILRSAGELDLAAHQAGHRQARLVEDLLAAVGTSQAAIGVSGKTSEPCPVHWMPVSTSAADRGRPTAAGLGRPRRQHAAGGLHGNFARRWLLGRASPGRSSRPVAGALQQRAGAAATSPDRG